MKKIFLIALLICGIILLGVHKPNGYGHSDASSIEMDNPGNCPICGMTLVKKTAKLPPAKHFVKKAIIEMPREKIRDQE